MTNQLVVGGMEISINGTPVTDTLEPVRKEINFVELDNGMLVPDSLAEVLNKKEEEVDLGEKGETNDEIPEYLFEGKRVELFEGEYTWKEAQRECEKKGGRLPDIDGLKALYMDYCEEYPNWKEDEWGITKNNPLALTNDIYWSSTEYAPDTTSAWYVNFNYGSSTNGYPKTRTVRVVCIYD